MGASLWLFAGCVVAVLESSGRGGARAKDRATARAHTLHSLGRRGASGRV